jgi:hypothetical protein
MNDLFKIVKLWSFGKRLSASLWRRRPAKGHGWNGWTPTMVMDCRGQVAPLADMRGFDLCSAVFTWNDQSIPWQQNGFDASATMLIGYSLIDLAQRISFDKSIKWETTLKV